MAGGCCIGQCRYRTFTSLQKAFLDSPAIECHHHPNNTALCSKYLGFHLEIPGIISSPIITNHGGYSGFWRWILWARLGWEWEHRMLLWTRGRIGVGASLSHSASLSAWLPFLVNFLFPAPLFSRLCTFSTFSLCRDTYRNRLPASSVSSVVKIEGPEECWWSSSTQWPIRCGV